MSLLRSYAGSDTDLELCNREVLAQTPISENETPLVYEERPNSSRSGPIGERSKVTMTLNLLRYGRDTLSVVQPALRFELPSIFSPKRTKAVDNSYGNGYLFTSLDENVVGHLTVRKLKR
jgi:hypothetical protein